MCAGISPSERRRSVARALAPVRQIGGTALALASRGSTTFARDVAERGGYRVRMPRDAAGFEAVLLNTGGGMAGGDRVTHVVEAEACTSALVTTPGAELVYRTLGPDTEVDIELAIGAGARLAWMPQETILHEGAALDRRISAEVDAAGRLLAVDLTVLGRAASGRVLGEGRLRDTWRIRRDGRLVFAENVLLDGDLAGLMDRPAVGGGARVLGMLVYVGADAADRLDAVRAAIEGLEDAAASSWNGLLVVRILAASGATARSIVARAVPRLMGRTMPRAWDGQSSEANS